MPKVFWGEACVGIFSIRPQNGVINSHREHLLLNDLASEEKLFAL